MTGQFTECNHDVHAQVHDSVIDGIMLQPTGFNYVSLFASVFSSAFQITCPLYLYVCRLYIIAIRAC